MLLKDRNYKPINVYRMADAHNRNLVSSKFLVNAFSKLLDEYHKSVFETACKAFGTKGETGKITQSDFMVLFDPSQAD
jgi:hypothetical protein